MNKFLSILLVLACCVSAVQAGDLTYGQANYKLNKGDLHSAGINDPLYNFIGEVDDTFNGTVNQDILYLRPRTAPSGPSEGWLYYDSGGDVVKFRNGSGAWVTFGSSGTGTLDEAYDQGNGITVDGLAVTLTVTDGANNSALYIDHNEVTNDNTAFLLENAANAANAISIDIDAQTTGRDIEGTGATWYVSGAGLATFKGGMVISNADVLFDATSAAKDVQWDDSAFLMHWLDNAILGFGGDADGDADITFVWDTSNLVIEAKTDNVGQIILGATNSMDFVINNDAADSTVLFDISGELLDLNGWDIRMQDSDFIKFGTDLDFTLTSDGTAVLKLATLANDESPIFHIGANTAGVDVRFYPTTTAEYMEWDAGNEALEFVGANIHLDDASILQFGTGKDFTVYSDTGNILEFDPATQGNTIKFGTSDSKSINMIWYSDVSGDTVTFDEENFMVEFQDVEIALSDGTAILFGDTIGVGDFSVSSTSAVLAYAQIVADTGEITYGASGTDIPIKWFAETTSDWVYFNVDEVEFEDVVLQIMDDTEIQFGDDDDVILRYDETTDNNFEIVAASVGMSIVTNDFIITTDGAAANQIKFDATGTIADASGDAIVLETTDGGILLNADNANNGDITLDAQDDVRFVAAGDITFTVTGNVRVVDDDLFGFGTNDNVTFNYDEDGDDNLQIVGPVDFETTYHEFREQGTAAQDDGTIVGVATGETNVYNLPGIVFEYFILGSGQSIAVPIMTADGLNVRGDESNDEGAEWGQGITARSRSAFTTNTDSFYIKVKFKIETVANMDIIAVGFRIIGAYDSDLYAYNNYVGLNVNNGTINVIEKLNGAGAAEDDSGDVWTDGQTKTLEVRIDASGDTTWWVDGSAISNQGSLEFDWADNDVVIPFFHFLGDATAGCELELVTWECGIYTQ